MLYDVVTRLLQLPIACLAILNCEWAIGQIQYPLHLTNSISSAATLIDYREDKWLFLTPNEKVVENQTLVRWGRWPGIVEQQAVWLTDGSWLAGEILDIQSDSLRLQHRWLDISEISWNSVRALVYTPAASLAEWIQIDGQLQSMKVDSDSDTVWLRDGSRLSGIIDWGPTGITDSSNVRIEVGGQSISIPWNNIRLLAMSPSLIGPLSENRSHINVGLIDGSLLQVSELTRHALHLELNISGLGNVKSLDPPEVLISSIRYLSNDVFLNAQRIDQLELASYKFLPDSELKYPLGINRSVYGQPMVVGRRDHAGVAFRGLAMRSSSQAAFRWDQSPGKLIAEVRLAEPFEETSRLGDAVCKVLLAKAGELIVAKEVPLNRISDASHQEFLEADITGAQLVILVVERAGFGQWGDQVYWLDARVSR